MDSTRVATVKQLQGYNAGWDHAYDRDAGQGSLWKEEPIACLKTITDLLQKIGVKTVAEVGCGDGRNTRALIAALPGVLVAGVEVSATALARCDEALLEANQKAFLLESDGVRLPFAAGSLDSLLWLDVFGQLEAPQENLAEAWRVLKTGGLVALNAFTPDDETFGQGEPVGARSYSYKGCLFRYFEETELRDLLDGWKIIQFDRQEWLDNPHGEFRPVVHRHVNWIVIAEKT